MASSFPQDNLDYGNNWQKEHLHCCSMFLPFVSLLLGTLKKHRTGNSPLELMCRVFVFIVIIIIVTNAPVPTCLHLSPKAKALLVFPGTFPARLLGPSGAAHFMPSTHRLCKMGISDLCFS